MNIVERLKRVKYTRERNDAPNGFSWDEPCDADDYGAEQRFVNPDGPEAADEIERLRKVLQEIADKDGWCSAKAVAKRLREAGYVDINTIYKMAEEAADEIELLRNERDRLREALQKIYDDDRPEYIPEIMIKHLYSHYTIARDALNGEDE